MTTDPDGAKRFYDAVVGWTIGERIDRRSDYRMIGRSDGGFAGGVLPLTDEMRSHGARPVWLGYLGVDDVDATVAQIEAKGGQVLMPACDIPTWPAHRDGRRSAGQSLLRHEARSRRQDEREARRATSSRSTSRAARLAGTS